MDFDTSPKARLKLMAEPGHILRNIDPADPSHLSSFYKTGIAEHPQLFSQDPGSTKEEYSHILHLLHLAYRWTVAKRPIYELTHSLAAALMLTEPPKMAEGEEIELPTPAFVIRVPEGLIPVFGPEGQGWAELIWVHSFKAHHMKLKTTERFLRWTTEWNMVSVWRDRRPNDLYVGDERVYVLRPDTDVLPQEDDEITMSGSLRLLRNLCSWLAATERESTEKPVERRRKLRKSGKKDKLRFSTIKLGHGVHLGPELRRMAAEVALGSSKNAREGWQLRTKHVVQGHWKMQAYGEGLKLRKRIWITPYWRGPEGEAAWAEVLDAVEGKDHESQSTV